MDARQRRTRSRLHGAVLALAAEQPADELSVTAVAKAAGVHRSTFYEHAGSPVALLEQALTSELDELRAGLLADDDADIDRAVTEVSLGVIEHVSRHAAIYRRGLGAGSGTASLHAMLSAHFRETSHRLQQLTRLPIGIEAPDSERAFVEESAIRFLCDGTVGAIETWLEQPDLDVDGFMRLYVRLVPAWWPRDLTVAENAGQSEADPV